MPVERKYIKRYKTLLQNTLTQGSPQIDYIEQRRSVCEWNISLRPTIAVVNSFSY